MFERKASIVTLIKRDIETGGGRTVNRLAHELAETGQVDRFKTGLIQVDVPGHISSTRVHLLRGETGSLLSLWEVGPDGAACSSSCELMTYEAPTGRTTVISGSTAQSLDGWNRRVSPCELADKINAVVKNLKRNGLSVVFDSNSN